MNNPAPIAFIDSGIGGLPYLSYLRDLIPHAPLVYVADNLHFPYGQKTEEEVQKSVHEMTSRLVDRYHPRLIVVACNTASMVALDHLRKSFTQDFVGVVPAVKPAAAVSVTRAIGVMATERSLKGTYMDRLVAEHASDCDIVRVAATELINTIETDPFMADRDHYAHLLHDIRASFVAKNVDTIVLGCTHFLHLNNELLSVFGNEFSIVDSRDGVSHQAVRVLEKRGLFDQYAVMETASLGIFHLTTTEPTPQNATSLATYQRVAEKFGLAFGGNL